MAFLGPISSFSDPISGGYTRLLALWDILASTGPPDIRCAAIEASIPGAAIARQLCVVVPTFNERDNVPKLFAKLEAALAGISWEVIFVDDNSPDGTSDVARSLAQSDPRVRSIRRIGRRSLSGACIEGILASSAPFVAVMDADLQHDETQLPKMLGLLQDKQAELVVGSRYVSGGDTGNFNSTRLGGSVFATTIAKKLLHIEIADPMSGFFMIRRDRFEQLAPALSVQGFKIFSILSRQRMASCASLKFLIPLANAFTARVSWIPEWCWISSALSSRS